MMPAFKILKRVALLFGLLALAPAPIPAVSYVQAADLSTVLPGVVGKSKTKQRNYDRNLGLLPLEILEWQRIAAPVFEVNPSGAAWDHQTSYYPVLARNLDRSLYQNGSSEFVMFYTGDNNPPSDYDQAGVALGTDFDTWTRSGSTPKITLGTHPAPDAGDVQVTSVFHDGSEFIIHAQGNATPPLDLSGDNVEIVLYTMNTALSSVTRHGVVLSRGSAGQGDELDMYRPKLIPAGHDGKPRLYYIGKNASDVFGIMGATGATVGDYNGPWTKISTAHLYVHGQTFLEDAWYEDGLYHFIYGIGGSTPGGLFYATSANGSTITVRRQIIPRRPGEWDASPVRGSYYEFGGAHYMFFDGGGSAGIGYAHAP